MSLKSFSLIEAALAQSFFSQISNLSYLGSTGKVALLYTQESGKDNYSIQLNEDQQGVIPADANETRLKALSTREVKWTVWLEDQVTKLKASYPIERIELVYDDAQPLNIDLNINVKAVSANSGAINQPATT
ncbi:hypothetical protein [Acinetobacter ursingii]|uniref:hypothetical protein n=1 Tax=Acinetobacter ursingii TaxID=108980 RepID=UPI00124D3E14|nr:hypothetical protein [Acinetobacter ursingii]